MNPFFAIFFFNFQKIVGNQDYWIRKFWEKNLFSKIFHFQVTIECGEENELTDVTEPAKCEYHFTFRTPLACSDPDKDVVHDEF